MCRYMGGKGKIGKEIASKIHEIVDPDNNTMDEYFEPFVGMCGVMRHVKYSKKKACDKNEDIVSLWKATQSGWTPPTMMTREEVLFQKQSESSPLRCFAAFGCSYGGMCFNSYIGEYNGGEKEIDRSSRSIVRTSVLVRDVNFVKASSYSEFDPVNSIVYCDPPYRTAVKGVRNMDNFKGFDHDHFWETMRAWSVTGNKVFISEYEAPDDFSPIWERKTLRSVSHKTYCSEKLFVFKR